MQLADVPQNEDQTFSWGNKIGGSSTTVAGDAVVVIIIGGGHRRHGSNITEDVT